MSSSKFRHIGKIIGKECGDVVVVALDKLAACEGCRAKGKCSSSVGVDGTQSVMRVVSSRVDSFEIGEIVSISITYRVGVIAVLFTYIIPLVLFLGAIITLIGCGVGEGLSSLVSFGLIAIYYVVIYLLRERFERVVEFGIEKMASL